MKNFMPKFNATKKISITSALFSLLILFFSLNGGFCTNFCSASNPDEVVDVNTFVNASVRLDQSGKISLTKHTYKGINNQVTFEENNNNAEEDADENDNNEEEAKNDASGSDEYDRNNSYAFGNASVRLDQFYEENDNNEEEDYNEYSPSGEGDGQKVKTKTSLNGEDQPKSPSKVDIQAPDVSESRYGDLCPTCLMI